MGGFMAYQTGDLDGSNPYWLVAWPKIETLYGYLFYNPDDGWHQEKISARSYASLESCEAQIALLKTLGGHEPK
jgi:hypothetical protein